MARDLVEVVKRELGLWGVRQEVREIDSQSFTSAIRGLVFSE